MEFLNHPEFLIEGVVLAIAGIIMVIRLEGKINQDRDRIAENLKLIEKLEVRIEHTQNKIDTKMNEIQNLLSQSSRSLAVLEGKLSINK